MIKLKDDVTYQKLIHLGFRKNRRTNGYDYKINAYTCVSILPDKTVKVYTNLNGIESDEDTRFTTYDTTKDQLDNLLPKIIPYVENDLEKERDYYKSRFEALNEQWDKVIKEVLGEKYYNDGADWYSCDVLTARDLIQKCKRKNWRFWEKTRRKW